MVSVAGAAQAAPDSLDTIRTLVAQGQWERAYEQGSAAETRYEGNPEFDFAYGMAALESGHHAEAILALERVVLTQPDQLRVRLELARAHFLAGNYGAADREFDRVLEQDPPAPVRANIDRFKARIASAQRSQRREIAGWLDARVGTDSNINSATDADTISTPLGDFDLVRDGQELEDEFARLELGGEWREPLTKDSSLDLSGGYSQKDNFDGDDFDLGIGRIEAGYSRRTESGRYRVGLRAQNVILDSDRFQNSYGVVGTFDLPVAQNWVLSLTGAATALRFAQDHARDADQFLFSGTILRPAGRLVHTLSLYGAVEPARKERGEFNGRDFVGALYGVQLDAERVRPYLRLGLQQAKHRDDHPVFAKTRDDLTATATAGVQWTLWKNVMFTGEASWTEVDSNLDVFQYERFVLEAGLRASL